MTQKATITYGTFGYSVLLVLETTVNGDVLQVYRGSEERASKEEQRYVEQKAEIIIKHVGVPCTTDLDKSKTMVAIRSLASVSYDTVGFFLSNNFFDGVFTDRREGVSTCFGHSISSYIWCIKL
ncbi:hypothetical protein A6R68_19652 [Neotoma lepida]|uniref:Uncharacterized protein n=1 Tax=Neotoma lepida TaxID=56216 RepID=A0A1A6HJ15_NEOLE|nr:hypothetical protein A6R68_19652 [Neotoma lepida]